MDAADGNLLTALALFAKPALFSSGIACKQVFFIADVEDEWMPQMGTFSPPSLCLRSPLSSLQVLPASRSFLSQMWRMNGCRRWEPSHRPRSVCEARSLLFRYCLQAGLFYRRCGG